MNLVITSLNCKNKFYLAAVAAAYLAYICVWFTVENTLLDNRGLFLVVYSSYLIVFVGMGS